ncbi:MAG: anthranilate phosphoribosyltransferase [Thermoplasmata archaeon]
MIGPMLRRLADPKPLSPGEVDEIFVVLMDAGTEDAERTALLVAWNARLPRAVEVVAMARAMRRRAVPFTVPGHDHAIDLCGSGGAPLPSFNISTVSSFVVAAAGQPVIKHGNRSARGPCGSSDLLEALGLPITTSPGFARASFRRYQIAFLHAPLFHPATHAVARARKTLGIPTVFNLLGPLVNPAGVPFQVVGLGDLETAEHVAEILPHLGVRRGLTISSEEHADEFSPARRTKGFAWVGRRRRRISVDPGRFLEGDERRGAWGPLEPARAAEETERILAGGGGARRGAILLTSGAALWVAGRVVNVSAGVERARIALDSGAAEERLHELQGLASRGGWGGVGS